MRYTLFLALLSSVFISSTVYSQYDNPAYEARLAARVAQEELDWQVCVAAYSFRNFTFFETVDKVADLGVDIIEGFNFQRIGGGFEGVLDPAAMSDEALVAVKTKLDDAGLSMLVLYYGSFPADEAACRRVFERSRELGVKYFVSEPNPNVLPLLDKLGTEYGMVVGLHGHDKKSSPNTWSPDLVLKLCENYSPAISAFSDTGHWIRSELEPTTGAEVLANRIVGFEIHDLHAFNSEGHDVPLGTGVGKLDRMMAKVAEVKKGPVIFSIEYVSNPDNPTPDIRQCIEFLDRQSLKIANPPVAGQREPGFYVGAATVDITPDKPCALSGQFNTRISTGVNRPVTANIIAVESCNETETLDYAIIISMDTVAIWEEFYNAFKAEVKKQLPQIDLNKIVLAATHTHSAPVVYHGYVINDENVMKPEDYIAFTVERITEGIRQAWQQRELGQYSYGLGHAVIAYNRRAVYEDGSAVMYGNTNQPNFRAIEGMEDHDVNSMFFWNTDNRLMAMLVNVSCPSQEVESILKIDPDFWGPTREKLHQKYGDGVVIVGLCGAAGDMSPHTRYRQAAEERMRKLRGINRLDEIARRLTRAVDEVYDVVKDYRGSNPIVRNVYKELELPERLVTEEDYNKIKPEADRMKKLCETAPDKGASGPYTQGNWHAEICQRYEKLKDNPNPMYRTAINVIRIGETVICTNQFELYTDFGVQMKARSKAKQTFVVQLSAGYSGGCYYLPSKRATAGGGYGAIVQSNIVGWEGGQTLVEETLKIVNELF